MIHLTWIDWRNGNADVFFNRSQNGGSGWQPTDLRLDADATGATVADPAICCEGSRVHVVWRDGRSVGGLDLYARSSTDSGASFGPTDLRVDHAPAGALARVPAVACAGNDGGSTWLPAGEQLDSTGPLAGNSYDLDLCCSGGFFLAVWKDDRQAPAPGARFDLFANGNIP